MSARPSTLPRVRSSPHTHTHTYTQKYVMIFYFPQQRWFRERTSILRHTYVASLVRTRESRPACECWLLPTSAYMRPPTSLSLPTSKDPTKVTQYPPFLPSCFLPFADLLIFVSICVKNHQIICQISEIFHSAVLI
jgi:hypothetical protein